MLDQQPNTKLDVPTSFEVSDVHISKGVRRMWALCFGALALKEKKGLTEPSVAKEGIISFNFNGKRYTGVCDALIEKVHDYDNDREVSPFVFHIEDVKSFDIKNKKGEMEWFEYMDKLKQKRYPLYKKIVGK